jgi:hypothetical protein
MKTLESVQKNQRRASEPAGMVVWIYLRIISIRVLTITQNSSLHIAYARCICIAFASMQAVKIQASNWRHLYSAEKQDSSLLRYSLYMRRPVSIFTGMGCGWRAQIYQLAYSQLQNIFPFNVLYSYFRVQKIEIYFFDLQRWLHYISNDATSTCD